MENQFREPDEMRRDAADMAEEFLVGCDRCYKKIQEEDLVEIKYQYREYAGASEQTDAYYFCPECASES